MYKNRDHSDMTLFCNRLWHLMTDKGIETARELADELHYHGLMQAKHRTTEGKNPFALEENSIKSNEKKVQSDLNRDTPGRIPLDRLLAYCEYFDCSLDYLAGKEKQVNHDLSFVCEYTGLSEKAVKVLRSWNKTTLFSPVAMLSRLIEQREDFGEILYSAWNYATNRAKAKNMNKKLTGKEDEHIIQVNTGQPNTQELLLFTAATRITSCIRNAFK